MAEDKFYCNECRQIPCHSSCPNSDLSKNHCNYCGQGIEDGEEYCITNDSGLIHLECINYISPHDLIDYFNIKTYTI